MPLESTIETVLDNIASNSKSSNLNLLVELIAAVRPKRARNIALASDRLRALTHLLTTQPRLAKGLRHYLFNILAKRKIVHLLTDTGITSNSDFWGAAIQRTIYKMLPPLINDEYVRDVFGVVFHHVDDYVWIRGVDEKIWLDLISALKFNVKRHRFSNLSNEFLSAIQVLSYSISAIGLEAELVRNYPDIERYESPFLRQNDEINDFVSENRAWLVDRSATPRDSQHIEVLLAQCEEVVVKIYRTAMQKGVSVSLTRLLARVTQSITRLRVLLTFIEEKNQEQVQLIGVQLFKELVYFDNKKYSLKNLIDTSTRALTLQVTEHAGRSGEHYVANNRREWRDMFRSAAGAGFIVGFMSMFKIMASKLLLAPFGYAFLYSLNYSLGFMLVHIVHCTIATKQPAMTAALIAKTIDESKHNLNELVELVVQVIRTQFIAIVGNVLIAFPTAFVIAWAIYWSAGHHFVTPEKARALLLDINPIQSLSLFHAAIAGVCLFLSGLISGYYDNKASYNQIPERLLQLSSMNTLFGHARWKRITDYIGNNLGALAGNFFFGIMLGSIGQLGVIFGLPIDIRHVTFASANFAIALAGLDNQLAWQVWINAIVGVIGIGVVNLTVSFSLALFVAMRSRNVSFEQTGELIALLGKRFIHRGRDFFFPPKDLLSVDQ